MIALDPRILVKIANNIIRKLADTGMRAMDKKNKRKS